MKPAEPLVSVCMPVYNCGKYVRSTLTCLSEQRYKNIEIIVVNDGSTDETEAIVRSFPDQRLVFKSVSNGGAAHARNQAFKLAKGDYILFFDADDFIDPSFIASQVARIDGRKDVVVLSNWGRFYNDDLSTYRLVKNIFETLDFPGWINYYWRHANPMTTPGRALIPRAIVEVAGLWDEALSLNDDLEFFTRVFLHSKLIVFNTEATFFYRSGIEGLSSKRVTGSFESLYRSVKISTEKVLQEWPGREDIRVSCANMHQSFIYEVYPGEPRLTAAAEWRVKELGGATLPFPAGGYTKVLARVLGWKATKRLKRLIGGR